MSIQTPTEAFDAAARAKAVLGEPLPLRMHGPAAIRRQSNFTDGRDLHPVWQDGKNLLMVDADGQIGQANAAGLATVVGDSEARSYRRLAPLDQRVRSLMLAVLAKGGDRYSAIHREVALLATMPVSSTLVTVASVLARKLWLPTGMDPRQIGSWVSALGFNPSDPEAVRELVSLAWAGELTSFQRDMANEVTGAEDRLLRASRSLSPRMQAVAFGASTLISEAWSAIERTDPILRDRYTATGDVVVVKNLHDAVTSGKVAGHINGLCKVSPGRKVVFTTQTGKHGIVLVSGLGYDASTGQTTILLGKAGQLDTYRGQPSAAKLGWELLREAQDCGDTVWVTGQPFLLTTYSKETRWNSARIAEQAPTIIRDMPLAVAVAGAPT